MTGGFFSVKVELQYCERRALIAASLIEADKKERGNGVYRDIERFG